MKLGWSMNGTKIHILKSKEKAVCGVVAREGTAPDTAKPTCKKCIELNEFKKPEPKKHWTEEVHEEMWQRFDEIGEENPSLARVLEETDYVLGMIKDGGCDYNDQGEDDPKWLEAFVKSLNDFKKNYGGRK
jgi:hypothetical protein